MKKTFSLLIMLSIMMGIFAQSTLSIGAMQNSNQQLIEDAVKEGIFITHRCYQLQDTTADKLTFYGWNNLNYFGDTYSLGIKVKGGYYLNDKAFRPWIYDSKFEEYSESKQFAPVLSASTYRMLEDNTWQQLPYKDVLMKEILTHQVYLAQDSVFHKKGFTIDCTNGVKQGWLVWVVADKPLLEQNDQIPSLLIHRNELTFESKKEIYDIKAPPANKTVLGGLFILPEFTDIGQVNFLLSGILLHENDKWQVVRVNSPTNSNVTKTPSTDNSLTPVNINQDTPQNKKNTKKQ